jgi:hypothetical protein
LPGTIPPSATAPLSGEVFNLSLRALQAVDGTPAGEIPTEIVTEEPTDIATETPTEVVTEEPTAIATEAPTEVVTETATVPVESTETATASVTSTIETSAEGTPTAMPPDCVSGPTPTPQPTPTPKPSNPGNPGGGNPGGGGGGTIPPVTDLPSTGNGAAQSGGSSDSLAYGALALIAFLFFGSTALRRRTRRSRLD